MGKIKSLACSMIITVDMALYEFAQELRKILGDIKFELDKTGDFEEVLTYRSFFLGHSVILQETKNEKEYLFEIFPYDTYVFNTDLIDIFDVVSARLKNSNIELSIGRLPLIIDIHQPQIE